ncbi:helix-turn-helix domain-containing protein [Streptomyces marincola]|uniref:helix-turn-helix domain-containing protein n=1 Tax=Streptomyces marincola TaxID=2878388 RepID=UPI001CF2129D|nr:helix-turn-helix domain-containing protein [Streptomyces marincola]UCM91017.1 helix-turn-helix domain-containing protein [Streptomyces marincola]
MSEGGAGSREAFIAALAPLVAAIGGEMIEPGQERDDDVLLAWAGAPAVAVRLPLLSASLEHVLAELARTHGRPLADLDRATKQQIVRRLEARGAFAMRHGVETVAAALGVSRFTVYNYLNRSTNC